VVCSWAAVESCDQHICVEVSQPYQQIYQHTYEELPESQKELLETEVCLGLIVSDRSELCSPLYQFYNTSPTLQS
jgi:hypothetical protein